MSFRSLPPLPPPQPPPTTTPPLSSEKQSGEQQHKILISNQSNLLMGVQETTNSWLEHHSKTSKHRKWVKLRTHFVLTDQDISGFSASTALFRYYSNNCKQTADNCKQTADYDLLEDNNADYNDDEVVNNDQEVIKKIYNNGCETQEVSVWLDDHEFSEGSSGVDISGRRFSGFGPNFFHFIL